MVRNRWRTCFATARSIRSARRARCPVTRLLGQATIDLYGIGSTRTLVLLDGRRAPRSPVTANQANDLNIIPLSAVDRIEVLTDSASAIYGSDAIGGVINVILRKDYDGLEVGTSLQRPTREGADSDAGVITIGGSTNRGRFLFTADFRNKGHIASADRFLLRRQHGIRRRSGGLSQRAFRRHLVCVGKHRQREFLGQHHLAILPGTVQLRGRGRPGR